MTVAIPDPAPFTIVLRFEPSPAFLAALQELVICLRPLFAVAGSLPPGTMPAGSSPSAVHVPAGDAPARAHRGTSQGAASPASHLPAAATQAAPPPVLSGGGMVKRGNRFGTRLKDAANWRTPARAAVVRRLYPAGIPVPEIRRELNALPGPEVTKVHDIPNWAFSLGLRRPPGTPNPFRKDPAPAPSATAPKPAPVASEPVETTANADPAPAIASDNALGARAQIAASPTWSAERIALLRRDYPNPRLDPSVILTQINTLPGGPISEVWMHNYAVSALKMSRRFDAPRPAAASGPAPERKAVAREAIDAWCRARGWHFEKFDIEAVNERCAKVGHPGFTLLDPARRAGAAA
jgi:hypothetical protein